MPRLRVAGFVTAFALACGDDQGTNPAALTVEVQASQDTLTALGDTVQLSAVVRNRSGAILELPVTWTTPDPAVVRLIEGGAVAEAPGSATVTATTSDGSAGSAALVVRQVVIQLDVAAAEPTVVEFDSVAIEVAARDANGFAVPDASVTWSADPPALARIEDGLLIGLEQGTVEVRAETDRVTGTTTVSVEDGFLVRAVNASSFGGVCAVDLDSAGYCWAPAEGDARRAPGRVRFASLTAGFIHSCGVTADGAGYCWGRNSHGELGLGTNEPPSSDTLVRAHGPMTFTFLRATAHSFTCGLAPTGTPFCWGHNDRGQLGRGLRSIREMDAQTPNGVPAMTVIDGDAFHACGIGTDGVTYCWGIGGVGDGSEGSDSPAIVSGGHAFVTLATGFFFTCAATGAGEAFCWGLNDSGQLGTGDTTTRLTPERVPIVPALRFVTAGADHACGLTAAGAAWCWGSNAEGQLGDGTTSARVEPVPALPTVTFAMLAAGEWTTCGITPDGPVFCWGAGDPAPRRIRREAAGAAGVAAAAPVTAAPPHHP